jgi:hypothetical protein
MKNTLTNNKLSLQEIKSSFENISFLKKRCSEIFKIFGIDINYNDFNLNIVNQASNVKVDFSYHFRKRKYSFFDKDGFIEAEYYVDYEEFNIINIPLRFIYETDENIQKEIELFNKK